MKKLILLLLIVPIIGFSQSKKYKPKDRETIFNQSCAIPAYPDARYNSSFKGWELEMWNGRELQALIADGFSKQWLDYLDLKPYYIGYYISNVRVYLYNYRAEPNDRRTAGLVNTLPRGKEEISDFDLEGMIRIFLKDLYNSVERTDGRIINKSYIENVNIDATFESLEGDAVAVSYGINDKKNIIIKADPVKWKRASTLKRWFTIYHELGHDVLNFRHGQGGKLMFNYTFDKYSWEEFDEDKQYMFERYIDKLNKNQAILN